MKKNFLSLGSLAMLSLATILIAGCSGEDGAPGPAGTNGTNGTNGANGANGANGVGFDEAVAKGSIILYLDGTRPDGVAFKDTINYRFASTNLGLSYFYNYQPETGVNVYSYVERYMGLDGPSEDGGGYIQAWGQGGWSDNVDQKWTYVSTDVESTIIEFPQEFKYFVLNADFYIDKYWDSETAAYVMDTDLGETAEITSYAYDVTSTGKVVYKYSGVVNAEENSTGHDLKVMVVADAKVYEQMQEPEGEGRQHNNGRTASKKVAKAEMKSIK